MTTRSAPVPVPPATDDQHPVLAAFLALHQDDAELADLVSAYRAAASTKGRLIARRATLAAEATILAMAYLESDDVDQADVVDQMACLQAERALLAEAIAEAVRRHTTAHLAFLAAVDRRAAQEYAALAHRAAQPIAQHRAATDRLATVVNAVPPDAETARALAAQVTRLTAARAATAGQLTDIEAEDARLRQVRATVAFLAARYHHDVRFGDPRFVEHAVSAAIGWAGQAA